MPQNRTLVLGAAAMGVAVAVAAYMVAVKGRTKRRKERLAWTGALEDIPRDAPVLLMDCQALVGEGLAWDAATQTLTWLDIQGCRMYRLHWDTREVVSWELPKRASVAARRAGAESDPAASKLPYLMAFEDGFAFYDPDSGSRRYHPGEYLQAGNIRLNDGRCDRQGRLVCGGVNLDHIDEPLDVWHATVKAYTFGSDLRHRVLLPGPFRCYNATCFSPDGATMYMTDTPTKKIMAYKYDTATGKVSSPRLFKEFKGEGSPDGATVDAAGNVWSAQFWAGQVVCVRPDGSVSRIIDIGKAKRTTCCCIGGPNLDTLFVTSACIGLSDEEMQAQPWAGGLMAIKLREGERGLPEPRFGY